MTDFIIQGPATLTLMNGNTGRTYPVFTQDTNGDWWRYYNNNDQVLIGPMAGSVDIPIEGTFKVTYVKSTSQCCGVDPVFQQTQSSIGSLLQAVVENLQELIDEPVMQIVKNCFDDPGTEFESKIQGYTIVTLNDDGSKTQSHFDTNLDPIPAGFVPQMNCC